MKWKPTPAKPYTDADHEKTREDEAERKAEEWSDWQWREDERLTHQWRPEDSE